MSQRRMLAGISGALFLGLVLAGVYLALKPSAPDALVSIPPPVSPEVPPWRSSVTAEEGEGWTELHTAAMRGDKEAVERCLAREENVNAYAKTMVLLAATDGRNFPAGLLDCELTGEECPEVVFVGGRCPPGVKTVRDMGTVFMQGETPLIMAVIGAHAEVARILLSHGADVNVEADSGGRLCTNAVMGPSALDFAVAQGNVEIVRMLLDAGGEQGFRPDAETSLIAAARRGHIGVIELLLKRGDDIEAKGMFRQTALHHAAANNDVATCALLISHGANVDALDGVNGTPLHRAAEAGALKTTEFLLAHGANCNATMTGIEQETPLFLAEKNRHKDVAAVLRAAGAKRYNDPEGPDALAKAIEERNPLVIKRVLARGGWNEKDLSDAIFNAAIYDLGLECMKELVAHGANPKQVYGRGQDIPLLHWAVFSGNVEVVAFLLDQGEDLNARDLEGETPLHEAARCGQKAVAELLLRRGADLNARAKAGHTPLWVALHTQEGSARERAEVADCLVAHGGKQ